MEIFLHPLWLGSRDTEGILKVIVYGGACTKPRMITSNVSLEGDALASLEGLLVEQTIEFLEELPVYVMIMVYKFWIVFVEFCDPVAVDWAKYNYFLLKQATISWVK